MVLIIFWFCKIYINNNFLGDLKIVTKKISNLLSQERYNYLQAFEKNKTRYLIHLEKKHTFTNLKKFAILYIMLQILLQDNILKKCQFKG